MTARHSTRRVTVRLGALAHEALEGAASREGVALAQYLREAALMRLAWERGEETGATDPQLREDVRAHLHSLGRLLGRPEDV